jgi:RHS repeat-associated protein
MSLHFTGKERDAESGNDYFGARYYSSTVGRFMSPDWSVQVEPVPYAKLDDPQSLNLYAYVGNNPLRTVDPDGHDPAEILANSSQGLNADVGINASNSYFPNIAAMTDPFVAAWYQAQQQVASNASRSIGKWFSGPKEWFGHGEAAKSTYDDATLLARWRKTLQSADAAYDRDRRQSDGADPIGIPADPTRIPVDAAAHDLAYANINYYSVKLGITTNGETPDAFMAKFESGLLPGLQQQVVDAGVRYQSAVQAYYAQFQNPTQ